MRGLLVLVVLVVVLALGWQRFQGWVAANPEKVPWTPLALTDPIGPYTARKLNALAEDTPLCLALLDQADVAHSPLPPLAGDRCGYDNAVTMIAGGAVAARLQPADVGVSCPVAAALAVWEREIVRPLALKHFGSGLEAIDHDGSYSCRNIAGGGNRSEHAAANALDVAGFRLEDGTRITLAADWDRPGKAEFLRGVRDGACALFGTTLSPDYNAAHADHFHLDQARREWAYCR